MIQWWSKNHGDFSQDIETPPTPHSTDDEEDEDEEEGEAEEAEADEVRGSEGQRSKFKVFGCFWEK